jgi:SAM-dependent methyltransferase
VLNAGCGEGLFAPLLLEVGRADLQVELDLSLASGKHLRSRHQRYVCGSLTHIPLRTESIDVVLCSEVLEHIPDDRAAVAELARVLTGSGWLLVSVPTPPAVPDANHVREGYSREELLRLLGEHGLRCEASRTCMHLCFRSVLRYWRPGRLPRALITSLARIDRVLPVGPPMDLVVLARKVGRAGL